MTTKTIYKKVLKHAFVGICGEKEGNMLYIGVDLGTSAVKLLLMNAEGKIESVVSKEYPLYFPHPGWSEQKPEDWWSAVLEGLKELTENCDKSQIAGISFGVY